MHILEVLRRPIITEKSTGLHMEGKYTFEVMSETNKQQIKQAVEQAFKVEVVKVNVMTVRGKWRGAGRRRGRGIDVVREVVGRMKTSTGV